MLYNFKDISDSLENNNLFPEHIITFPSHRNKYAMSTTNTKINSIC